MLTQKEENLKEINFNFTVKQFISSYLYSWKLNIWMRYRSTYLKLSGGRKTIWMQL